MMRLKVLRGCWVRDSKRGMMVERKVGELFEMDEKEEKETIHDLLSLKKIIVADEKFIPSEAEYLTLSTIEYVTKDGFNRIDPAGTTLRLSGEVATPLLIEARIRPTDPRQWTLRKLLKGEIVETGEVKKMYDVEEPSRENWVTKPSRVRSGRE